ncbi:MAG: hypothetical protein WAN76_19755 [Candidatus Sulfotelmatobacter sp.]
MEEENRASGEVAKRGEHPERIVEMEINAKSHVIAADSRRSDRVEAQ